MDEQLTVKAWNRYGMDRLHVTDSSGRSLGFLDRAGGVVHVDDEAGRSAVARAVGLTVPEQQAPVDEYAVVIGRWATDLGANAPGAGARVMAQQHRAEAPVRTLLARVLGVHTDERAWRAGAQREETVGKELARLGAKWTVLHDVPVGDRGANIDHVLVGPPGVFTVNSKWHAGKHMTVSGDTVRVDGYREPYVPKARHEAARASRLLSAAFGEPVPVTGIVAVLAERWAIKEQPRDGAVLVTAPRTARKHLQRLPERHAVHELDRLAMWARRSTTWQP